MPDNTRRLVDVKKGESIDRSLKRLKTMLDSEGILEEMRRRRAFEDVTTRAKRKARSAKKRYKVRWKFQENKSAELETHDLTGEL